ncbi:MAG TPA: Maf family protein [Thermoanaerobaculia bacterium]
MNAASAGSGSLVLASGSPRRVEILNALRIPFEIDVPGVDETVLPGESGEAAVSRLAAAKAAEVAARRPGHAILAADTLVLLDGNVLGKPGDPEDAVRMLALLAGREHRVVTAVRLRVGPDPGREVVEESRVRMSPMTREEIGWYVATGEPLDKAGAYAVQGLGARFIDAISGSFTNVMGLPARGVYRLLREARDPALVRLALASP